jgi:ABC-type antimicrobial peptide transport system permease subunit
MNSLDLIRMGLKNLFRRKTRTFLTVLGVIIGTASIVIMVSLGFGMKYSFQNQLNQMGSMTVIDVYQSYGDMGGGMVSSGKVGNLDDAAIAQFSQIEGVQAVTPIIESYARIVSGKYIADTPVRGIIPETMEDFELKVGEGRLLSKDDAGNIVFGSSIPINFMDARARSRMYYSPPKQGEKPKVNVLADKMQMTFDLSYGERRPPMAPNEPQKPPKLFKVKGVGILHEGQRDADYAVYMDINYLKKIIQDNAQYQSKQGQNNGYNNVSQQLKYQRAMVKVKDMKYVKTVQKKVKDAGFQANSLNDVLDSMQKTAATIQLILGGIGAISLLVAALGITNTMIMSIYERTREIGIMKVIGASLSDIRRLFLFESGMIGFMGGVLGLIISEGASLLLNSIGRGLMGGFLGGGGEGSKLSIIPLWMIGAVLAFTCLVGLISGYYPAKRAMKLSALEAIRTE